MNNSVRLLSKKLRIFLLSEQCELCQNKTNIIIHHTAFDDSGQKVHDWWRCQLRCQNHENELHANFDRGNSSSVLRSLLRNNRIIIEKLEVYLFYLQIGTECPFLPRLSKEDEKLIIYAIKTLSSKEKNFTKEELFQMGLDTEFFKKAKRIGNV